jgi:hypothetical protein
VGFIVVVELERRNISDDVGIPSQSRVTEHSARERSFAQRVVTRLRGEAEMNRGSGVLVHAKRPSGDSQSGIRCSRLAAFQLRQQHTFSPEHQLKDLRAFWLQRIWLHVQVQVQVLSSATL